MAGVAPPALAPGGAAPKPAPQVVPPRVRQPEVVAKPVLIGPPERKAPQAPCLKGLSLVYGMSPLVI